MKKTLSVLLCISLMCLFCACTNQNSNDYSISFDVDGVPGTLDPQLVTTASELTITSGIFEGLLRLDKNGTVITGAAERYEISNNGKTYTFTLREGLLWSDEKELTAHDFAYGIKRALLPETRSPYASLLFCIKNAKAVFAGELSSQKLGIEAIDDRTLILTLDYADPDFTHTLTQPLCMPCRQDFFESTNGKYGMNTDLIICNGPFYVRRWSQTTSSLSMRLTRSKYYYGKETIGPSAVLLYFNNSPEERVTDLIEDQQDSGYIRHSLIKDAHENKLKTDSAPYANWAIYFHPSSAMNASTSMRAIFAHCIDDTQLNSYLTENLSTTDRLLPLSYSVGSATYGAHTENYSFSIQQEKPSSLSQSYQNELKTLQLQNRYTLLYCNDSPELSNIARAIAQCWQKELGVPVTLKTSTEANLSSAIRQGDYDAALIPIGDSHQQIKPLLSAFSSSSPNNVYGFSDVQYDTLISQIQGQNEVGLTAALLGAEKYLIENAHLVPIVSESRSIVFDDDISNIQIISIWGNIDFRDSIKEN